VNGRHRPYRTLLARARTLGATSQPHHLANGAINISRSMAFGPAQAKKTPPPLNMWNTSYKDDVLGDAYFQIRTNPTLGSVSDGSQLVRESGRKNVFISRLQRPPRILRSYAARSVCWTASRGPQQNRIGKSFFARANVRLTPTTSERPRLGIIDPGKPALRPPSVSPDSSHLLLGGPLSVAI